MSLKNTIYTHWITIPAIISAALMILIYITDWNTSLFLFINSLYIYGGEVFWANITIIGDTLVASVLILPWLKKRSDIVWTLLFAGIAALFISHGLKAFLQLPRPPAVLDKNMFHIIGPALTQKAFPSGHTTTVFTFAYVLILFVKKNLWRNLLFSIALLIGLSRVIVGVHWPLDILGGILVGIVSALLGFSLYDAVKNKLPAVNPIYISGIIVISAIVLIFIHNTRYPQAIGFQVIIGLTALVNTGMFFVKLLGKMKR